MKEAVADVIRPETDPMAPGAKELGTKLRMVRQVISKCREVAKQLLRECPIEVAVSTSERKKDVCEARRQNRGKSSTSSGQ